MKIVQRDDEPELLGVLRLQSTRDGKPHPKFITRIKTLKDLKHPNILNLLDYNLEAERPYMVTELCKGGTLRSTNLSEWSIHEKRRCFRKICDAFAYLWVNGLSKSDHNFKNIFLKEDKTPVIGDFESASEVTKDAKGLSLVLKRIGYNFWEIMEGMQFNNVWAKERQISKEINELTKQIEELKQQKADLLS